MSRIVVLGGAESGVGAAVLAKVKGHEVFLSDKGKIKDEYVETLKKWDIPFEEGRHTEELILNADEVVKSPGIPGTVPMVQKLRAQGTHIVSEIEFAAERRPERGPRRQHRQVLRLPGRDRALRLLRAGDQQLPAGRRVRLQAGHRHHHEHHPGPPGPLRPQDGELRGREVQHHEEPHPRRLLHLRCPSPRRRNWNRAPSSATKRSSSATRRKRSTCTSRSSPSAASTTSTTRWPPPWPPRPPASTMR